MGYDVHITRASSWTESEDHPIAPEELRALVGVEPDLALDDGDADTPGVTLGPPGPEAPCLWASGGEITTKNPDPETVARMVRIARRLGARVEGDDGEVYDLDDAGELLVDGVRYAVRWPEPAPAREPAVIPGPAAPATAMLPLPSAPARATASSTRPGDRSGTGWVLLALGLAVAAAVLARC